LSDLKLYSVYSPPERADSAVRRTKADTDAAEECHQRPPRVAANQASLPAHIRLGVSYAMIWVGLHAPGRAVSVRLSC
jgi:hypothetical protein